MTIPPQVFIAEDPETLNWVLALRFRARIPGHELADASPACVAAPARSQKAANTPSGWSVESGTVAELVAHLLTQCIKLDSMKSEKVRPVKLHRRHVNLDGRAFTVLTLRPSTDYRYATNYFHETWHVLTDPAGAWLLGRLCWSLAFQRQRGTIVVIDHPLLVPNPFDADKSSPIVIANADLAPLNRTAITQLKRFLAQKKPSEGTVRLATSGLDRLLAADPAGDLLELQQQNSGVWWNDHQRRGWTDRVNGVVVLAAPPPVLQWWAIWLSQLGSHWYQGSDYTELDHPTTRRGEGEVQVFASFVTMVTEAMATRERLFPGVPHRELLDDERRAVWAELPASTAESQGESGR